MKFMVVLDAAAFDVIDAERGVKLRTMIRRASDRSAAICCAAVTLAEVCRGTARTHRLEAALARDRGGQRIQVIPTDTRLAKLVGMILHQTGSGSERLADAHVVAICARADSAVVLTSDPGDIAELATALPGTRVVARDPVAPL